MSGLMPAKQTSVPKKPATPTSTPRNNSILTGVTGDTQANIKRYQLEDATRKKRKSLLGE